MYTWRAKGLFTVMWGGGGTVSRTDAEGSPRSRLFTSEHQFPHL